MKKTLTAVTLCVLCASALCADENPRVLLIGDSICGYYFPYVKGFIGDEVDLRRGGTTDTRFALAHIDGYLEKHKPDVIHFNCGLHDLKPVKGRKNNVPIEEYEKNLRELIRRMKKTNARLVFATTTPVGPRAARKNADVIRYNAVAVKVMKEENVAVNDLYAIAFPIREKIQHTDNVHFKPYYKHPEPENEDEKGSKILGKAVAGSIVKALKKKN